MTYLRNALTIIGVALILSACGGGGGSDSGGTTAGSPSQSAPTPTEIISNAADYSEVQLSTAAKSLADAKYTGMTTDAAMDIGVAQNVFQVLFDTSSTVIPTFIDASLTELADSSGAVDTVISCDYGGSISLKGELSATTGGNMTMEFTECSLYQSSSRITGLSAIAIQSISENAYNASFFYDDLTWQTFEGTSIVSGYVKNDFSYDQTTFDVSNVQEQYATVVVNNADTYFINATSNYIQGYAQNSFDINGYINVSDIGKISFSSSDLLYVPPYLNQGSVTLVGDKTVNFNFEGNYIRYAEDTDGDGIVDAGTYLSGYEELLVLSLSPRSLVALSDLSLPPIVSSPWVDSYEGIYTTTPIVASLGSINDPDTPAEELQVSFKWYVNDVLINDQTGSVLPAGIAVFGDTVEVSLLVSDGGSTVESVRTTVTLLDSPAQVSFNNVPSNIRPGDTITFTALVSDPDLNGEDASPTSSMVAAPSNATIDENGLVTWDVPNDLLFPEQSYTFTFNLGTDDDAEGTRTIEVAVQSDSSMPLARTGSEVPYRNQSMVVGDFMGNGSNQILATDSTNTVFLLTYTGEVYEQTWVYPFKLMDKGNIIRVMAANMDEDSALEIIVVSETNISVIYDLDKMATEIFTTEQYIKHAVMDDLNNDGSYELAYLASDNDYYSSNVSLYVSPMENLEEILFTTEVEEASEIAIGNVDNDSNLEIVINNGLVYDALTYANEWFSSNQFGDSSIVLGDFDNDGIEEVAGINRWGDINVYSVVDRALVATKDNFNSCTILQENIDSDAAKELIIGDCQWGNITAYNVTNNALVEIWSINSQDHGSVSLTSGDSDNDGALELHWGSGVSHSGGDVFVSADLSQTSISLKDDANAVQLDSYNSAGWSTVTDGDERAVFFVARTGSGYDGSRYVLLDDDGNMELSEELGSNWDSSQHAVTTDFNQDGFGDMFLPLTTLYDGAFGALQISNGAVHWQDTGEYSNTIGVIKAIDFNQDGFEDALYIDGDSLKIIDVYNELIIANLRVDNYIHDFAPIMLGDTMSLLVSQGERLVMYTYNGSLLSEQGFVEQQCDILTAINYDADSENELLCLGPDNSYNSSHDMVVYELADFSITEAQRNAVAQNVYSLVVDPSTDINQNVFVAMSQTNDSYYFDNEGQFTINKMSADAHNIWTSPNVIGEPTAHGLKARMSGSGALELMLSTREMMYVIK